MIKWERKDGKVLEFDVKDTIGLYADGEYVGNINYLYPIKDGGNNILEFRHIKLDKNFKLKVTDEIAKKILLQDNKNKEVIDNFFRNLDNVKINCLSYTHYYIDESTEDYETVKNMNKKYFTEKKEEWIEENKKYFIKTDEVIRSYESTKYIYVFKKSNMEKVDNRIAEYKKTETYKEQVKSEKEFLELCELAEKSTDIDFEDMTGLKREWYLI